jgi:hypothetical protein
MGTVHDCKKIHFSALSTLVPPFHFPVLCIRKVSRWHIMPVNFSYQQGHCFMCRLTSAAVFVSCPWTESQPYWYLLLSQFYSKYLFSGESTNKNLIFCKFQKYTHWRHTVRGQYNEEYILWRYSKYLASFQNLYTSCLIVFHYFQSEEVSITVKIINV